MICLFAFTINIRQMLRGSSSICNFLKTSNGLLVCFHPGGVTKNDVCSQRYLECKEADIYEFPFQN